MQRTWRILGILAFTQILSWGALYYAFSILAPFIGRTLLIPLSSLNFPTGMEFIGFRYLPCSSPFITFLPFQKKKKSRYRNR